MEFVNQAKCAPHGLRLHIPSHGRKRARQQIILMMLVLIFAASASPVGPAQDPLSEYELKAAFLFNFAKFIDWPGSSFASPQSPFFVCILGRDPFGGLLDSVLSGKAIADRPLTIERLKDKKEARNCEVVFISASESRYYADIFDSLRGASILSVGETEGFATSGGIIEFTLEDKHVRFTINTDAADKAGLKVSSKLLSLARIVHTETRQKDN